MLYNNTSLLWVAFGQLGCLGIMIVRAVYENSLTLRMFEFWFSEGGRSIHFAGGFMRISNIKISNYRNIDGIGVCFNPDCNYIIGENNLGKSNFLSLLGTVCNGKGFDEKDFSDPEKAIEVELDIRLLPNEKVFSVITFHRMMLHC
jgi:hypothetical protein